MNTKDEDNGRPETDADSVIEVCFYKTISPAQCRDLEESALPPVLAKAEEFIEEARLVATKNDNQWGSVVRATHLLGAAGEEIEIESTGEALYVLWVVNCPRIGCGEATIYLAPKGVIEEIADNMEHDLFISSRQNLEATIIRRK